MEIDQSLLDNYEKAIYMISRPSIELHVHEANTDLDVWLLDNNAMNYTIITAYNPNGKITDLQSNTKGQLELEEWLSKEKFRFTACLNLDPANIWPEEPSFLIFDIALADALALGKRFAQKAIVYGAIGMAPELKWVQLD